MRPSLEELTELIDRERPPTEEIYTVTHSEKPKSSPQVDIPHTEPPNSLTLRPIRNLIDKSALPESPAVSIGRLRQRQAKLETTLRQRGVKYEEAKNLQYANAIDLYLAHCETTSTYERHQLGSLWKSAMQECGAVVVDWRKVSAEDVCDAILAVRGSMLPPLNSWRKLMDATNKVGTAVHRMRVRKYSKLLADYLNNEHHFDRDRQKRAADQRALLRYLRLHTVINPFNHERINTSQALHPATIDLMRMSVAVSRLNSSKAFGKHTDQPLHRDYLDELVPELQLTVSKGEHHVPPLHKSLEALAEPWKRSHFTRFMESIISTNKNHWTV